MLSTKYMSMKFCCTDLDDDNDGIPDDQGRMTMKSSAGRTGPFVHSLDCLLAWLTACSLLAHCLLTACFACWRAHSLAPRLMGRRFFSMSFMRRFHTVSNHCTVQHFCCPLILKKGFIMLCICVNFPTFVIFLDTFSIALF